MRGAGRREACLAEIDARAAATRTSSAGRIVEEVEPIVDAIATDALGWIGSDENREPVDVRVTLRDGRLLTGTVAAAHGDVLLTAIYSRLGYTPAVVVLGASGRGDGDRTPSASCGR